MDEVNRAAGPTERMLATIAEAVPSIGLAVTVLLLGLAGAVLLRRLSNAMAERLGLDALAERFGVARLLYAMQVRGGLAALLSNVVALVVGLVTISMAAEIVGLPGVADGVGTIIEFLPRLVSAGVVALFGFGAADFASRLAEGMGRQRSDIIAPKFAANVVYYLVLAVVLTTAVQHLGMQTSLIDMLIGVASAAVFGSMAMAVAWASRLLLQDVLTRPYVLEQIERGATLHVGDIAGVVVATNTLTVSLRTEEGRIHVVPYRRLLSDDGFSMVVD